MIGMLELQALCDALRHFLTRTPNRWELVAKLVSSTTVKLNSLGPDLCLQGSVRGFRFKPQPDHCRSLSNLLHQDYPALLKYTDAMVTEPLFCHPEQDAFKPLVLLPHVDSCCEMPVMVRNRPSFPLVYTTQGTLVAACFHSECRSPKFRRKYYLSHYEVPTQSEGHTAQYYYNPTDCNKQYFQVWSHSH